MIEVNGWVVARTAILEPNGPKASKFPAEAARRHHVSGVADDLGWRALRITQTAAPLASRILGDSEESTPSFRDEISGTIGVSKGTFG